MGSKRPAASSEARNGGGRAPSSKRSRKGNKKKTAAHKRLLKLLHEHPTYIMSEWATELRDRLVDGGVHNSVTEADIRDVLTRLDKGVAFICRAYDENHTKYYRHHCFDAQILLRAIDIMKVFNAMSLQLKKTKMLPTIPSMMILWQ
jgi:hypothetical protein